jgi:hypothetical protein
VQVRAANVGAGDSYDDICWLLDSRIGNLFNPHISRPSVNKCFHKSFFSSSDDKKTGARAVLEKFFWNDPLATSIQLRLMRRSATYTTAFARRSVIFLSAPTRTGLFSTVGRFIYGRPRPALCLLGFDSPMLITFFDVFGLALLFSGVA